MSYKTEPIEELQREAVTGLEGEGFAFNPATTRFSQYLATCLGSVNAYKTKRVTQMLAELNAQFGGSAVSRLTSRYSELLDTLETTISGGGGGAGYVADAVHFDGNAWLMNASLTASNSGTMSMSLWVKMDPAIGPTLFNGDPDGNYTPQLFVTDVGVASFQTANAGPTFGVTASAPAVIAAGSWHHILISIDTNQISGSKVVKLYFDDVDRTTPLTDDGAAFLSLLNGVAFVVGSDSLYNGLYEGDIADLWISTASLLVAGNIPEANRRKFIDAAGKPVDPVNFPTGFCLFSGDASGFATNQGTGGAFTLTGSLSNASTSPSD